jgi:aspartate aminotransferase
MEESLTIAMTQKARELKEAGREVLSFSAGEPDFDTPRAVKDAAIAAIEAGFGKYTAVPGIPELLEAIAGKLKRENNLTYPAKNIVVSNGAKHSLFNLFAVLLSRGNEVIIPTPTWVSYPEMVRYHGGETVFVQTKEANGFKMTPDELKAAISPKTHIVMLNSPSNPTGAVYTRKEYEALGKVLEGTDILVFSDEMYEKLVYDVPFTALASVSEDLYHRTITINGLSKSVAMTGWRMGYFASPDASIVKAVNKLQSQMTSNVCSIVQKASIPALDGSVDKEVEQMRKIFQKRRDLAAHLINQIEGLHVIKPDGAFYLYVNCQAVEPDSMKFALSLLEQAGVAVVPGCGFEMEGYVRLSFATSEDVIERGIEKMAQFVKGYRQ